MATDSAGRGARVPVIRHTALGVPRKAWAVAALIALVLVFVLAGLGPWMESSADFLGRRDPHWVAEDFAAFYSAGWMVTSGVGSQIYNTVAVGNVEHFAVGHAVGGSGVLPYFNPPFFALLFAPLAHLPIDRAYQVWTVINLGLIVLNCFLLWRIAEPLPRHWRLAIAIGYLTLYPLSYAVRIGQFSLLLQASMAAAYLLLRSHRERLAGATLGVLLVKPELLVPVAAVLLWKRRWRVFEGLIPVSVAAIALSIGVVGTAGILGYPQYLINSLTHGTAGVADNFMFSWIGIVAIFAGSTLSPLGAALAGLLSVLTLVALVRIWRGAYDADSPAFGVRWAALTAATALVDPHLYLQDTLILVPGAVALLASRAVSRRGSYAGALVAGWGVLNALGLIAALGLGGGLADVAGIAIHLPG